MFNREVAGRVAKVEISVYDAMIAEIMNERNAEKEKHRRQRSDARKHKETKQKRRETKQMRSFRLYEKSSYIGQPTILMRKIAESERVYRADYEIEMGNHAEIMEEINALDSIAESFGEFSDPELIAEIEEYITESHRLWLGEEYFRKQQSRGINARLYLKSI